jgi:hypothetical protein
MALLIERCLLCLVLCTAIGACNKKEGKEKGPCYGNGTCDEGLTCLSDTCVSADEVARPTTELPNRPPVQSSKDPGCIAFSLVGLPGLFGCSIDSPGPTPEVMETSIKLDLPAVPAFDMPSANPDGSHPVLEMTLKGKLFLDTEIRVQGVVLWIYDCATAIRTPGMSDKELKTILETQPERCTRPHFVIGQSATTNIERGLEVVETPRPLRKDELGMYGEELEAEMAAALAALPAFQVGDNVIVTGEWSLSSPKGFHNSEGLLTYGSMVNLSGRRAAE